MAKPPKPKAESKKGRNRQRFGKRKGAAGGRSELRYYPKYGDHTDWVTRALYKVICLTPSSKWGCDSAGKEIT
jgi:hypothetical protein